MTNQARIEIVAEDRFSAVTRRASAEFDRLKTTAAGIGRVLGTVGGAFGLVGGAAAAAATANITRLVGAIDDLDERAQGLQVTATALADLQLGAQQAGVGADQLDAALTRLNIKLTEAGTGNREAAQLFKALGVSIRDSAGNLRGTDAVLRDVADRFRNIEDGSAKSALAVELFGKSGAKLLAFLNQGGAALSRYSGLTEETVKSSAALQSQFDRLSVNAEILKNRILSGVIPALASLSEAFVKADDVDLPAELARIEREIVKLQAALRRTDEPELLGQIVTGLEGAQARAEQLRASIAALGVQRFVDGASALREFESGARRSAEEILRLARANDENAAALKRSRRELELFRAATADGIEGEAEARILMAERMAKELARLDQLLGRAQTREIEADLARLDKAFFDGLVGPKEYDAAVQRLTGSLGEVPDKAKAAEDSARDFGLVFASSLGQFIESGGAGGANRFLESLAQDLLKLTTQMLVVKPIADALAVSLKNIAPTAPSGSKGIGDLFAQLFNFGGARALGGPVSAGTTYLVGERGPELFTPSRSGQIVPNGPAVARSMTVVNNITVPGGVGRETASQLAGAVSRRLAFARFR